jgi:hypothetical protein
MCFVIFPTAILVAALPSLGCGTVANLCLPINDQKTFGGVQADMKFASDTLNGHHQVTGTDHVAVFAAAATVAFPILDMPFSFGPT